MSSVCVFEFGILPGNELKEGSTGDSIVFFVKCSWVIKIRRIIRLSWVYYTLVFVATVAGEGYFLHKVNVTRINLISKRLT